MAPPNHDSESAAAAAERFGPAAYIGSGAAAGRALLLLDVDGVLQPAGNAIPPGYRRLESAESVVVLNQLHGEWLRELATRFEIVWATTWEASANQAIGARLGLPKFGHIDLGELSISGTRKLEAVQRFVGDQPCAWVDDELYDDAQAWADSRTAPTLLLRPGAYVGLKLEHVARLHRFAEELDTR